MGYKDFFGKSVVREDSAMQKFDSIILKYDGKSCRPSLAVDSRDEVQPVTAKCHDKFQMLDTPMFAPGCSNLELLPQLFIKRPNPVHKCSEGYGRVPGRGCDLGFKLDSSRDGAFLSESKPQLTVLWVITSNVELSGRDFSIRS